MNNCSFHERDIKSQVLLMCGSCARDCDPSPMATGEPFSRYLSDWQEGQAMEKPLKDAGSCRKEGKEPPPSFGIFCSVNVGCHHSQVLGKNDRKM